MMKFSLAAVAVGLSVGISLSVLEIVTGLPAFSLVPGFILGMLALAMVFIVGGTDAS